MIPTISEIAKAALALPEGERAELADLLTESLDLPSNSLHPEWAAELRRRVEEFDSGRVKAVSWEEVRRQIQGQLDRGQTSDG